MTPTWMRVHFRGAVVLCCVFLTFAVTPIAVSQMQGSGPSYTAPGSSVSAESNSGNGKGASEATGTSIVSGTSSNPYLSSVPEGKATGAVLPLSFKDALDRALRNNLGLLISTDNSLAARAARWQELSKVLPNVHGEATQAAQQIDL